MLKMSCSRPSGTNIDPFQRQNRRTFIQLTPAIMGLTGTVLASPAVAADVPSTRSSLTDLVSRQTQADSLQLEKGLLESRVLENVLSPPSYGMEGPDVIYPSWFSGTWNANSKTTDVQAPCGVALFGGNATFSTAQREIGTSLLYTSRFVPIGDASGVIADREYNVKSIAKVAMGANSVVDVSLATPNQFSCLLSPNGSPTLLQVDLIVLNRRQEIISDTEFHCSEVVREIVSPVGVDKSALASRRAPLLKEVETTSLYQFVLPGKVTCRQRSATFLLPSQQDPMALKMWEATRGRPIDVRFYDVIYTKS